MRDRISGRLGLMYLAASATDSQGQSTEVDIVLFPLMINGLLGQGAGRLELGLGPVLGGGSGSGTTVEGVDVEFSGFGLVGVTSTVGYRYQPVDGGLVFRAGLTPFLMGNVGIWGGLSLGYVF